MNIAKLYNAGCRIQFIADAMGRTKASVQSELYRMRQRGEISKRPSVVMQGSDHDIARLYNEGLALSDIADRTGRYADYVMNRIPSLRAAGRIGGP